MTNGSVPEPSGVRTVSGSVSDHGRTTMKTHDTTVQELVMDELRWDPTVDAANIGVAAHNGAITLSGHVPSYWQFVAAEKAAKRVRGVVAVANELDVHLPGHTLKELYDDITRQFGSPVYQRIDAAATRSQKRTLSQLSTDSVSATELAGENILAKVTVAPGNAEPIGGLKVMTENAWFAARPSGTEDVYKIYAESFLGPGHLARVQAEAQELVSAVL